MKKFFAPFIIVLMSIHSLLWCHGFGSNTLVRLADDSYQQINKINWSININESYVISCDIQSKTYSQQKIKIIGWRRANSYIYLSLSNGRDDDEIICASTQKFYVASKQKWIAAYALKKGDELWCAYDKTLYVVDIIPINEPINLYFLEVDNTHTFFVGHQSVLAHNHSASMQLIHMRGTKLPSDLRDQWFDILKEEFGLDIPMIERQNKNTCRILTDVGKAEIDL